MLVSFDKNMFRFAKAKYFVLHHTSAQQRQSASVIRRYDLYLFPRSIIPRTLPCRDQPGRVILSGRTSRSNSAGVTKPSRTASSFNVVPRAWADLATFAALS